MSRAQQAADRAAAWIIRQENGGWDQAEEAAFNAWLAQSDGNKAAYWRLKHSWQEASRIRSLGMQAEKPARRTSVADRLKPVAIAASLLGVLVFGAVQFIPDKAPKVAAVRYDTPVGGYKTVPLADGSRIELNTSTRVRSAVSGQARDIWLEDGEAFFEVARDPDHPFVVHAGSKTVTVLGTKFSVRRDGEKIMVSVLEGRVRIDDAASPAAASANSATINGGVIAISQGASMLVTQRSSERVKTALAWRQGMLSFDQTSLGDVAAEFNRYNVRQIIVTDRETASIRIGGAFQASNVDAFARLLRDAYGLKVVASDAGTIKITD